MKILVTGAKGFIAKNLIQRLKYLDDGLYQIFECDRETSLNELEKYCCEANFIFHLAGVNRPQNDLEFMEGNYGFTSIILGFLKKHNNTCPIMLSSSIQALLSNAYGKSKKAGEELLKSYKEETGAKVLIYRLPNVFGKWSKPNYNSVIATFCHNISHNLPIVVSDREKVINLVYIDDLIEELINALNENESREGQFCKVNTSYEISLGAIADYIKAFKCSRGNKSIPNMGNLFEKKLYSTYLSFLPKNNFKYELKMNINDNGSFTEFLKTPDRGQVSVNVSKPGTIKGNHWHHTKNEKFLVVSGRGVIRFRRLDQTEIIEYFVSANKFEVIDIPVGYTHNIENLGEMDLVTIMWANEEFDPENPDTYYSEV